VISNQQFFAWHICPKIALADKWRGTDSDMNLFCPGIPQHLNNSVTGGASDNGIVNHDNSFTGNCFFQYIQLYSDARLTAFLLWFNKRPSYITVFYKR